MSYREITGNERDICQNGRGEMVRFMAEREIENPEEIRKFDSLDILSEEICHLNRNMYLNENEQTKNIIRSTIKVYRIYNYAHRSCK